MFPMHPATLADIPALHALIERAYRGEASRAGWTHEADFLNGPRTDIATLTAIIADSRETMLVARDGDRIAACVQVSDKGDTAYLGFLAVEPTGQANGLGRTMIADYERRGYALTGETRPFPAALLEGVPLAFVVLAKPL
jgi:predicted N-acetyltransferase YhbS